MSKRKNEPETQANDAPRFDALEELTARLNADGKLVLTAESREQLQYNALKLVEATQERGPITGTVSHNVENGTYEIIIELTN